MKKVLLFCIMLLMASTASFAQVIYQGDFEAFNVGDHLAVVDPDNWTTWSNAPGGAEDPVISNDFAHSGTKSVKVTGTNDCVYPIPNYQAGHFKVSFQMYIPTGYNGYFNLLQNFAGASSEWGMQVFFDVGGMGSIDGGAQAAATFNYTYDTWHLIQADINLDDDWAEFYLNGNLIHGYVWSTGTFGTGTLNQLGGMNLYAWAENGPPLYYFDDVVFEEVSEALYEDDFESYTVGSFLAQSNPTWWTTWTNAPGGPEDGPIVTDYANSGTKSVTTQGTTTDLILKLGDLTTGSYQLKFWYYIPSGKGGYFNIQHFESPGIEWAYEVYFGSNGQATLSAGATNVVTFDFNHDTWFLIDNLINIDDDNTQLYVDGDLIYEWPFSYQASSTTGTLQLGGVDIYAGAPTGDSPKYYLDDIAFIQLGGGAGTPSIAITPTSLTQSLTVGGTATQDINVANVGELDLTFNMIVTFPEESDNTVAPYVSSTKGFVLTEDNIGKDPDYTVTSKIDPTDDVVLHYDGDNASAVGLTNGGPMRVAAKFTADMVQPYIGMMLSSVEVFINDPPTGAIKVQVYAYGLPNIPGPGEMIYEQSYNAASASWNTINLTTPIMVTGGDLWVGYWVDHAAGTFPAGCDAGPANANGDWISTGPGWQRLSISNPSLNYNWNIRATLTGTAMDQWLTVNPSSGTVVPGANTDVAANFDASGLAIGNYYAEVVANSNDPNNSQVIIPVNLGVITGISENEAVSVVLFPNPASDYLYIKSDVQVNSVKLLNSLGQIVFFSQKMDSNNVTISTSGLDSGIYLLNLETSNGTITKRIMIN